jgi:CBS domain-containing protein
MVHLYGLQGRVFSGALEQWRATAPVRPAARVQPVSSAEGRVLGFVSRSDLLRAIVADPPLDLWS